MHPLLSPQPSIPLQAKKSSQSSRGFHAMYNSRKHLWKRAKGSLSSSGACFLPDRAFTLDTSYTLTPFAPFSFPPSPFPPAPIVSDNGRRRQLSSANKNRRSHRLARYQQTVDHIEMPLEVAVVAKKIQLTRSKQAVEIK